MHTARVLTSALVLALASCTVDPGAAVSDDAPHSGASSVRTAHPASGTLDVDIIQRTCALYVTLRSHAWKDRIAFGRDLDEGLVRWNRCPGGTMIACVVTPTANGDSVITGIPFTPDAGVGP